jgi:hypothetical protein
MGEVPEAPPLEEAPVAPPLERGPSKVAPPLGAPSRRAPPRRVPSRRGFEPSEIAAGRLALRKREPPPEKKAEAVKPAVLLPRWGTRQRLYMPREAKVGFREVRGSEAPAGVEEEFEEEEEKRREEEERFAEEQKLRRERGREERKEPEAEKPKYERRGSYARPEESAYGIARLKSAVGKGLLRPQTPVEEEEEEEEALEVD